ncbi:hypothetical protein DPMN_168901 [Dreissena polymorpha]|uniref:Uncharacterized protein n=1 Tax=Dreissena polymorpha TaxID=45954 RepID=A0A9D4F3M6_DREPO|nr:hypothetical protein DPMN_168901 [Dreissena polymorpha]
MRPTDFSSSKNPFYLAMRTNETAFQSFMRKQLGVDKLGQMLKAMAKEAVFPEHKIINEPLSSQIPGPKTSNCKHSIH